MGGPSARLQYTSRLVLRHRRSHQRPDVGGHVAGKNFPVESPFFSFAVMDLGTVATFEHRHYTTLATDFRYRCPPNSTAH